jgi:predicted phage baseplate assembly protein
MMFDATYRIGNGADGNIGADAIAAFVSDYDLISVPTGRITSVTNPLPARGGVDAESMERVRQNAPAAFRVQERAVTAADYGAMAQRCSRDVQRAAATFRWTGSWHTVFVTVDRKSGHDVGEPKFRDALERCLDRYRMAGHDLRFDLPRFVPLEIEMIVCVKREYFKSDVERALRDVLGTATLIDGRRGFFHPDNFTFGQSLYLSKLLATAYAVEGVDSIDISVLQRQGKALTSAISSGSLDVGPLEIVQLENDPNFRERGVLTLDMRGGR